ncbi:hypothetical protein [uncultured Pseudokineococcus sp.]|uniref:hypothetical protein n=1 Tax=uncultured Pseudokineococcus sp. TaxID=1642928 RepID=UPI002619069F|nr:hypothetical protein [uncultured Pseudokineococcus sp.]
MSTAVDADSPYAAMVRGALLPSAAVSLSAVPVAFLVAGSAGAAGAALAAAVVVGSGGLTLAAMRVARDAPPEVELAMAMLTYGTKVVALGALLVGMPPSWDVSRTSLAVVTVLALLVWTACLVRTSTRLRLPVLVGA